MFIELCFKQLRCCAGRAWIICITNSEAQDRKALRRVESRNRGGAGYIPSPSCLHFFARRLFSVNTVDRLLLMASGPSLSILLDPGTHSPVENSSSEPTTSHGRLCASSPGSGGMLLASSCRNVCAVIWPMFLTSSSVALAAMSCSETLRHPMLCIEITDLNTERMFCCAAWSGVDPAVCVNHWNSLD